MSVVVSVRIPKWVKEKLEAHNVNVAELIRNKLLEEARRLEEEELARRLEEFAQKLRGKVDPYELARIVCEERKKR